MDTFTTEIWIDAIDDEIEVEVEFHYLPACRGSRDSMGVPLEPDDPEDVEDIVVTNAETNEDLTEKLSESEMEDVVQQCFDHVQSMRDYAEECRAEAIWESRYGY